MSSLARYFSAVLLALSFSAGTAPTAAARQQPSEPAPQPLARIVFEGDMAALLTHVAQHYRVNIGLEVYPWQRSIHVRIDLKDPTLRDVLDAVTRSAPGYVWREGGGDFEVLPAEGGSPFLETQVGNLRASDVDQAGAVDLLMGLPEVLAAMGGLNLSYKAADRAAAAKKESAKFTIDVGGVSLRRALHDIAGRSGGRFWVVRRRGVAGGEVITIGTPDRR